MMATGRDETLPYSYPESNLLVHNIPAVEPNNVEGQKKKKKKKKRNKTDDQSTGLADINNAISNQNYLPNAAQGMQKEYLSLQGEAHDIGGAKNKKEKKKKHNKTDTPSTGWADIINALSNQNYLPNAAQGMQKEYLSLQGEADDIGGAKKKKKKKKKKKLDNQQTSPSNNEETGISNSTESSFAHPSPLDTLQTIGQSQDKQEDMKGKKRKHKNEAKNVNVSDVIPVDDNTVPVDSTPTHTPSKKKKRKRKHRSESLDGNTKRVDTLMEQDVPDINTTFPNTENSDNTIKIDGNSERGKCSTAAPSGSITQREIESHLSLLMSQHASEGSCSNATEQGDKAKGEGDGSETQVSPVPKTPEKTEAETGQRHAATDPIHGYDVGDMPRCAEPSPEKVEGEKRKKKRKRNSKTISPNPMTNGMQGEDGRARNKGGGTLEKPEDRDHEKEESGEEIPEVEKKHGDSCDVEGEEKGKEVSGNMEMRSKGKGDATDSDRCDADAVRKQAISIFTGLARNNTKTLSQNKPTTPLPQTVDTEDCERDKATGEEIDIKRSDVEKQKDSDLLRRKHEGMQDAGAQSGSITQREIESHLSLLMSQHASEGSCSNATEQGDKAKGGGDGSETQVSPLPKTPEKSEPTTARHYTLRSAEKKSRSQIGGNDEGTDNAESSDRWTEAEDVLVRENWESYLKKHRDDVVVSCDPLLLLHPHLDGAYKLKQRSNLMKHLCSGIEKTGEEVLGRAQSLLTSGVWEPVETDTTQLLELWREHMTWDVLERVLKENSLYTRVNWQNLSKLITPPPDSRK